MHCGKFYTDFHNLSLHNFTLVTAVELNVNGGTIWAHERRKFWFTDLWNNSGSHEIRWKEDFRMTQPAINILCTSCDLLSQREIPDPEKQFQ